MTSSTTKRPRGYDYDDVALCNDDDEDCDIIGESSGLGESNNNNEIDSDLDHRRLPVDRHFDDTSDGRGIQFETKEPHFNLHIPTSAATALLPQPSPLTEVQMSHNPYDAVEEREQELDDDRDVEQQIYQPEEDGISDEFSDYTIRRQQSVSESTGVGIEQFGTNLGLIAGIVAGIVVLLCVLIYALARYSVISQPSVTSSLFLEWFELLH